MSGGGNRVTCGKMRLGNTAPVNAHQSQRDMTEAEAKLQQLEYQLEQHVRAAAENEAAVKAAQDALQPLSTQLQKEELAVQSLRRKVEDLKRQLQKINVDMDVRFFPSLSDPSAVLHEKEGLKSLLVR
jgi:chromosome segregation ATPase